MTQWYLQRQNERAQIHSTHKISPSQLNMNFYRCNEIEMSKIIDVICWCDIFSSYGHMIERTSTFHTKTTKYTLRWWFFLHCWIKKKINTSTLRASTRIPKKKQRVGEYVCWGTTWLMSLCICLFVFQFCWNMLSLKLNTSTIQHTMVSSIILQLLATLFNMILLFYVYFSRFFFCVCFSLHSSLFVSRLGLYCLPRTCCSLFGFFRYFACSLSKWRFFQLHFCLFHTVRLSIPVATAFFFSLYFFGRRFWCIFVFRMF